MIATSNGSARFTKGIFTALVVALLAAVTTLPALADTFYGYVEHVSTENIKVYDPRTEQTKSFLLVPKFDQVFQFDGKTTYQMKRLRPGTFVKVIYDQHALGARHADKIVLSG